MDTTPHTHTTLTPGEIHEGKHGFTCTLYTDSLCTKPFLTVHGLTVAECEANAAFIVKAVNNHADLVAAMAAMVYAGHRKQNAKDGAECATAIVDEILAERNARALLAKVEGGK